MGKNKLMAYLKGRFWLVTVVVISIPYSIASADDICKPLYKDIGTLLQQTNNLMRERSADTVGRCSVDYPGSLDIPSKLGTIRNGLDFLEKTCVNDKSVLKPWRDAHDLMWSVWVDEWKCKR